MQGIPKSAPVLNLTDNSKILKRKIKVRCVFKAESCSYLMVYAGLKLNNFYESQGITKQCRFLPIFGKISCYFFILRKVFYCWPKKPVFDC